MYYCANDPRWLRPVAHAVTGKHKQQLFSPLKNIFQNVYFKAQSYAS